MQRRFNAAALFLHSTFFLFPFPKLEPMERLALSWGNARQFTKLLLSLLSHIGVRKLDCWSCGALEY